MLSSCRATNVSWNGAYAYDLNISTGRHKGLLNITNIHTANREWLYVLWFCIPDRSYNGLHEARYFTGCDSSFSHFTVQDAHLTKPNICCELCWASASCGLFVEFRPAWQRSWSLKSQFGSWFGLAGPNFLHLSVWYYHWYCANYLLFNDNLIWIVWPNTVILMET